MVAAPIVAMGLIWPDSQPHILGRAETAVMMILNLFLRPSFIVMGFLASIMVCWVGVNLLNLSFLTVIDTGAIEIDALFGPMILQFVYIGLVYSIVKQSFGLITGVPDKVLHWIGDRSQSVGGAEDHMGSMKGQGDEGRHGGKAAAEGAGQTGRAGIGAFGKSAAKGAEAATSTEHVTIERK
jgi:defect-in-organelle-trafficking protein DotA